MAAKALADLEPDADAWKTFYLGNKPPAYAVDQTAGTRPLWQALDNLDQAKSNYGAIVYNKAPAVLKQLEYLVGDSAFQRRRAAFPHRARLRQRDLARPARRRSARAARRPLDGFGRDFMLRPGMPVVEQRLAVRDGRIARLSCSRAARRSRTGRCPAAASALDRAHRGPARLPRSARGRGCRSSCAAPSPRSPPRRAVRRPTSSSPTRATTATSCSLLDSRQRRARSRAARSAQVDDAFLRAMLWGALWDQVRGYAHGAGALRAARAARAAARDGRADRAGDPRPGWTGRSAAYLRPEAAAGSSPRSERVLRAGAGDAARPYGVRKAYVDAFIGLAASAGRHRAAGLAALGGLGRRRAAARSDPLGRRDPPARARRADGRARARRADAARHHARTAGAARSSPAPGARARRSKREYFTRYFADSTLNEEWAIGQPRAVQRPGARGAHLPLSRPGAGLAALHPGAPADLLPRDLARRVPAGPDRRFGARRGARVARRPPDSSPLDLRRKVLQHVDELERTVRIRRRGGAGRGDAGTRGRKVAEVMHGHPTARQPASQRPSAPRPWASVRTAVPARPSRPP